jgi:hypothetical protein
MPDPVKDFPKKYPRNSHFRHLEDDVSGMPDHLGSDLDQLLTQRSTTEGEPDCPRNHDRIIVSTSMRICPL